MMSPKEKKSVIITINFIFKNDFFIKYVVLLVLLAMMLKYSKFKIHIPVEYLISNNFMPKEII